MEQQIFREKSIARVSSPEELNEYLRVSNPGVWMLLAAVAALLLGIFVWALTGHLESKVQAYATVQDGIANIMVDKENASEVRAGMTIRVGTHTDVIDAVSKNAEGGLHCMADLPLPDGRYEVEIITEEITPIRFLFP